MQYRALHDGWIAGQRVAAGDLINLTNEQAKYELVEAAAGEAKTSARKVKSVAEVDPQ